MDNMVYVRLFSYIALPLLAMVPGITVDQVAHTVTIDYQAAVLGIAAGAAGGIGIFKVWGKK